MAYAAELIREERAAERPGASPNGHAVGVNVARLDSPATVTGAAKYAADLKMPGMLHGKLLRAQQHHARILSIDVGEALALDGVEAVVTADDIPGTPFLPNCQPQVYVFPKDRIRFKGEALAGVAAVSEAIAEQALKRIKVELEVLPHAIEVAESAAPAPSRSTIIRPGLGAGGGSCGDIAAGFAQADVIIENDYRVPVREHAAMEPEAALAYEADGQLVIKTGLYHAFVQGTQSIANNLAMKQEQVRIVCPAMGGNFGTRGDTLIAVAAGLMAQKTGKPVRMVFTRAESILGSCKAPSVDIRYRTGATRDGRIVAVDVEVMHGAGSWAPFLIDKTTRGIELCYYETLGALLSHATGPYEIENVRARAWDVLTNGPRYVPLRGTNANYLPLAYESQVDLVAEALGLSPLEVRLKNAIRSGSKTHFGQVLTEHVSMVKELELLQPHYDQALARLDQRRDAAVGPWRPGLGVGAGWRNIGYLKTTITAGCRLDPDGKVHALAGTVEQGQGPTTQFAQIAADSIGVSMPQVRVTLGDTTAAPYPVPTFSSVSTVGTGKAVQMAAEKLRAKILACAADLLQSAPASLSIAGDCAYVTGNPDVRVTLAEIAQHLEQAGESSLCEAGLEWSGEAPTILYGYNAGLIELDVNVETGEVRLLKHVNVTDPGTRINPLAVDGQIDGAIAFGIGFALSERFHPDNPATLEGYGLSSTLDIPPEVTRLYVEDPLERGPFGAKSIAEHPGISPIPGHHQCHCQRHGDPGARHSRDAGSDQGGAGGRSAGRPPAGLRGTVQRNQIEREEIMGLKKKAGRGLTRRRLLAGAGALAGTAFLDGKAPAFAAGKRKLRYIAFINRNTVWGKPYDFLAAEVDRLSGGELEIEYAGGSDVIGGFDAPEAVANGVFDMSHSANSYFAGAVPASISLASGNASIDQLRASGALDAYADMVMQQRGVMFLGIPLSGVGYVFSGARRAQRAVLLRGPQDPLDPALRSHPAGAGGDPGHDLAGRGLLGDGARRGRRPGLARHRAAGLQVLRTGQVRHAADLLPAAHGNAGQPERLPSPTRAAAERAGGGLALGRRDRRQVGRGETRQRACRDGEGRRPVRVALGCRGQAVRRSDGGEALGEDHRTGARGLGTSKASVRRGRLTLRGRSRGGGRPQDRRPPPRPRSPSAAVGIDPRELHALLPRLRALHRRHGSAGRPADPGDERLDHLRRPGAQPLRPGLALGLRPFRVLPGLDDLPGGALGPLAGPPRPHRDFGGRPAAAPAALAGHPGLPGGPGGLRDIDLAHRHRGLRVPRPAGDDAADLADSPHPALLRHSLRQRSPHGGFPPPRRPLLARGGPGRLPAHARATAEAIPPFPKSRGARRRWNGDGP